MFLSLSMLHSALGMQNAHIISTGDGETQPRLRAAALWDAEAPVQESLCYVLPSARLDDSFFCPVGSTLVVVGAADPARLRSLGVHALLIPASEAGFDHCFNRISEVFRDYQDWTSQLNEALAESASLQTLVSIGERFFGVPILVFDRTYRLLNRCDADLGIDWIYHRLTREKMLPDAMVEQIRAAAGQELGGNRRRFFSLSSPQLPYDTQLVHVSQGSTVFTIAVPLCTAPRSTFSEYTLSHFSDCIGSVLCKGGFHYGHSQRFGRLVEKLLSNEQVEQAIIDQALLSMDWLNTDHYVCAVFEPNCWDQVSVVGRSICLSLENTFPGCFAALHDGRILALLNLDRMRLSRGAVLRRLGLFLRDRLLHIGVSDTFFDFSTVVAYYRQALAALEMGHIYAPEVRCYAFGDYALAYFMHYGTSQINGRHLCHPDLVQLYLYDSQNGTELLPTLREYLTSGLNITMTAARLQIHRNTLYQRLDKISKTISADLNDPDTRLYMLLSYSLVELLHLQPVTAVAPELKKNSRPRRNQSVT